MKLSLSSLKSRDAPKVLQSKIHNPYELQISKIISRLTQKTVIDFSFFVIDLVFTSITYLVNSYND